MLHIIVYTRVPRITTHVTTRVELLFLPSIINCTIINCTIDGTKCLGQHCSPLSFFFFVICFLTPPLLPPHPHHDFHCCEDHYHRIHCLPLLTTAYHCYQLATTSSLLPLQNHDGYNKITTHPPFFLLLLFLSQITIQIGLVFVSFQIFAVNQSFNATFHTFGLRTKELQLFQDFPN